MGLVSMKQVLNEAQDGRYAIGQFNINSLEWIRAILIGAEKKKAPVILGGTKSAIDHMGGFKLTSAIVSGLIEEMNIQIPVVLHLDHGSSFEQCKEAIDSGFTSVMIDAADYPLEKNIEITSMVVDYAKKNNVSVEAQLGNFEVGNTSVATVEQCVELVLKTGIDCLAPALGSKHGDNEQGALKFDEMMEISKKTNTPLSLHGGTGIHKEDLLKAIECGTHKININTNNMVLWSKKVREFLNENPKEFHPRKIFNSGIDAIISNVEEKIEIFGSTGKVHF